MNNKQQYSLFKSCFVLSMVAQVSFFYFYFKALWQLMAWFGKQPEAMLLPGDFMAYFTSPALLVSAILLFVCSITYCIIGIILIAKNKSLPGGEQALWIIGFALMGFVAAIVFMIMAPSRGLLTEETDTERKIYP